MMKVAHQYPIILEWRVIGCLKCHLLQIVRTDRKTRKCLGCGYHMKIDFRKIRVWFKSRSLKDTEYALQKLKMMQKRGQLRRFAV